MKSLEGLAISTVVGITAGAAIMKLPGYKIISSIVFMAILITMIVQASTTKLVAKKLGVLEDKNDEKIKIAA